MLAIILFLLSFSQPSSAAGSCVEIFQAKPVHPVTAEFLRSGNTEMAEYYEVIGGTASLSEAKVIIIGDVHGVEGMYDHPDILRAEHMAFDFMRQYIYPGDVVLTERIRGTSVINNVPESWESFFTQHGITTDGWDSQLYNSRAHDSKNKANLLWKELFDRPSDAEIPKGLLARAARERLMFIYIAINLRDEILVENLMATLKGMPKEDADAKLYVFAGTDHAFDSSGLIKFTLEANNVPFVIVAGKNPQADYVGNDALENPEVLKALMIKDHPELSVDAIEMSIMSEAQTRLTSPLR